MIGTVCAFIDFALAALSIALALPLARRKVRMNIWYGARLREAFISEESWYDINEYAGRQMIRWSLLIVGAGVYSLVIPFVALDEALTILVPIFLSIGALIVALVMPLIQTIRYAARRYPGHSSGVFSSMFFLGPYPQADQQGLTAYSVLALIFILLFPLTIITIIVLIGLHVRGHA